MIIYIRHIWSKMSTSILHIEYKYDSDRRIKKKNKIYDEFVCKRWLTTRSLFPRCWSNKSTIIWRSIVGNISWIVWISSDEYIGVVSATLFEGDDDEEAVGLLGKLDGSNIGWLSADIAYKNKWEKFRLKNI